MRYSFFPAAAAASFAFLAACEVKRDEEPAEPPPPTPTASETISSTENDEEAASIIRPDVSPSPVLDLPPDPLAATVGFPDGGYQLDSAAKKVLREVLESDQTKRGWPIVLRGHTDSAGNDEGNLFASRKRAEAVAGWLAENGIAERRIEVIGLGEGRPVVPNVKLDGTPDERGRAKNRRVEVWVAPAGMDPADESEEAGSNLPDGA